MDEKERVYCSVECWIEEVVSEIDVWRDENTRTCICSTKLANASWRAICKDSCSPFPK